MAAEHRRVIAETPIHAQALAQNLARQDFVIEVQTSDRWLLRKTRRRGDVTVSITIRRPSTPGQPLTDPPRPVPLASWGPPSGPMAR